MRHGSFQNRQNRNNRHRGGQQGGQQRQQGGQQRPHRNQVFDSNGPDVRVRGTAFQINEKYMSLAKDASSSGDLILAENYLQHAEHYQRMINEFEPQPSQHQPQYETQVSATSDEDGESEQTGEEGGTVTSTRAAPKAAEEENSEEGGIRVVRRQPRRRATPAVDDDADLGLPTSILGGDAASA